MCRGCFQGHIKERRFEKCSYFWYLLKLTATSLCLWVRQPIGFPKLDDFPLCHTTQIGYNMLRNKCIFHLRTVHLKKVKTGFLPKSCWQAGATFTHVRSTEMYQSFLFVVKKICHNDVFIYCRNSRGIVGEIYHLNAWLTADLAGCRRKEKRWKNTGDENYSSAHRRLEVGGKKE